VLLVAKPRQATAMPVAANCASRASADPRA